MNANAEKPFLIEIAVEEIPASYIKPALSFLMEKLSNDLRAKGVSFSPFEGGATPRRIVIHTSSLATMSQEKEEEIKGPPFKVAYDASGNPGQALLKFMENNGLNKEDLFEVELEKGKYIFARKKSNFGSTQEILDTFLREWLVKIPFPKRMTWVPGSSLSFARPVRNIYMVHGSEQIKLSDYPIPSESLIKPRFYYLEEKKDISGIDDYFLFLQEQSILVNFDERRSYVLASLQKKAEELSAILHVDENLLDTVTNLVETPFVAVGTFEEEFLEVPDCALISVMKDHQKYFPLLDKKGHLINKFLFIANQEITPFIVEGNEKVIRARFKDAQFFYKEDLKKQMDDLADRLDTIMFTREAGNLKNKSLRVQKIIENISTHFSLSNEELSAAQTAARLAKADQLTNLVYEFPELEGEIGAILSRKQGFGEEIATAILDQYLPRYSGGPLPQSKLGAVLSIAEKIDTLLALFATGKIPSGSADPYALRRQALGIQEIIIDRKLFMDFAQLFEENALHILEDGDIQIKNRNFVQDDLIPFFAGRLRTSLEQRGFLFDEIDAWLSQGKLDLNEGLLILGAFQKQRKNDSFKSLISSFKRINNILASAQKSGEDIGTKVDPTFIKEDAEKDLYHKISVEVDLFKEKIDKQEYTDYFELLLSYNDAVNNFFDSVMVMDKDRNLRANRLTLLNLLEEKFNQLLKLEKIQN